jgi:hypothetical protein
MVGIWKSFEKQARKSSRNFGERSENRMSTRKWTVKIRLSQLPVANICYPSYLREDEIRRTTI